LNRIVTVHRPVLLEETIELLNPERGGAYLDGTLGGGGHALALLERIGGQGRLIGIDRDAGAIGRARDTLAQYAESCVFVQGRYSRMRELARQQGTTEVNGVLLDVGLSSDQLNAPERGFSFASDGPLDMRMDRSTGPTAAALLASLSADELKSLLWTYGEERRSGRISRAIVEEREKQPIEGTAALAELVSRAVGGRRGKRHPATRTFQALRIAVNGELDELADGLAAGLDLLVSGGRFAVITFHSLEDRLVKRFFARHVGRWESLQQGGREWRGETPAMTLVNRKPVVASTTELAANPRARSAKLRVAARR
jgi:16S rRNA (cytosine1402-N4)-methyltransferase